MAHKDDLQIQQAPSLASLLKAQDQLRYDADIGFDDAVAKAKLAAVQRDDLKVAVTDNYHAYIAELSTVAAVEHGGISEFAKAAGLNYGRVKTWRHRHLPPGMKRKWQRKVATETLPLPLAAESSETDNAQSGVLPGHEMVPIEVLSELRERNQGYENLKSRLNQVSHENRKLKRQMSECPHCGASA
ncbi:MAG: hypothetical protein F4X17_14960 [Gemmatimonadetes bacterium]|nr:hypothetical protein [Gemmatimonadota bacterium]